MALLLGVTGCATAVAEALVTRHPDVTTAYAVEDEEGWGVIEYSAGGRAPAQQDRREAAYRKMGRECWPGGFIVIRDVTAVEMGVVGIDVRDTFARRLTFRCSRKGELGTYYRAPKAE